MFLRPSLHTGSLFAKSSIAPLARPFALVLALGAGACHSEVHATRPAPTAEHAATTPLALSPPLAPLAQDGKTPAPTPATFDVADLAERATPVVVNITARQKGAPATGDEGVDPYEFFFGPKRGGRGNPRSTDPRANPPAIGTGFIITPDGYVATNAHVIEDAIAVKVKLADEREFDADIVGRDVKLDLALLKLRGANNLPAAVLGSSESLRVGEHVLAVGNPFGLGHTVTLGIVSAKARSIRMGDYDDFIQTDASINPGNSGGPLFNWRGEVIGINSAIRAGANGIGFAIPVDALKDVLPQLRDKGFVERGKLGILFQPISSELGKALGLTAPKGALVADLVPGGAGERAGIKQGDVVVAVNGALINHAEDLPRNVARNGPGTTIKVSVLRSGKPLDISAKLDALQDDNDDDRRAPSRQPAAPNAPNAPASMGKVGLRLSDSPRGGAQVDRVLDADSELEPGDVISHINGTPVTDAKTLEEAIAKQSPGSSALLQVKRGRATRFAALPIPAK